MTIARRGLKVKVNAKTCMLARQMCGMARLKSAAAAAAAAESSACGRGNTVTWSV